MTIPESKNMRESKKGKYEERDDKRRSKRSRSNERRGNKQYYHDLDNPSEEYSRYYGEDSEKRQNSDRYWNKYPKYPKKEDMQIGRQYYGESSNKRRDTGEEKRKEVDKSVITPRKRKTVDLLTSRTGGAYIPPAKLRMMQVEITDKFSAGYQRIAWQALKKSIHGYINKINIANIGIIARELLSENIVRGRGLLCKSIIQAQAASPTFTNVYAALVSVINSKFPNIGELLLKRLVLQFKRGFKQNNKSICISGGTFIAYLVNQRVAHEILALEILTLLVESPTNSSVEVAISFLKECGLKLTEVSSKGINAIFEMLRSILHEGQLEKRIQYMIEIMFQVRKDGFKDHAAVFEELDSVEEEDQFTHLITLDDVKQVNAEDSFNVFKFDDHYEENEGKYQTLSKEILQTDSEAGSGSEGSDDESGDEDEKEKVKDRGVIIDNTETNIIALRRLIYLTIQSSLDYQECAHKLMKMEQRPGQEVELCHMFLDCCAEQRTYEKFYGLLAQCFCQLNKICVEPFQQIFKDTYATTHRLDANRLRNVSKFFAHLLFTDAISWEVLEIMKLNEEDTTSSSRVFIKILFQELAEYMGLSKLNTRLKNPSLQDYFAGLLPRDNPKNIRFAINFFSSIGLGGLTDELREHLKNTPKNIDINLAARKSSSSSNSCSSSSDDSSEESSSSASSSSEDESPARKKSTRTTKADVRNGKKDKVGKQPDVEKEKNKRRDPENNGRKRRDYDWEKSRHEENVRQFKIDRKAFERPYQNRSRSNEEQSMSRDGNSIMIKQERDRVNKRKRHDNHRRRS